jgi:hypothetical protein
MIAYTVVWGAKLPSCVNTGDFCSGTDLKYFPSGDEAKRQEYKFISPQLSINISHGKFYSNCKSSILLFRINLIKWIVMKHWCTISKGNTFFFIFNMLTQIPIYAEFINFFSIHMILFSSDIPSENSYICKGIQESLAWKRCHQKIQMVGSELTCRH